MGLIRIKYIGPFDEVVDSNERATLRCKRGGSVQVEEEKAGRPPEPRHIEIHNLLPDCQGPGQHELRSALVDELLSTDPGCGMLAQYEVWVLDTEPVPPASTPSTPDQPAKPAKASTNRTVAK